MPRFRRAYPPELRRQMVELVRSGRTPEELAREFEPTAQSIANWVRQAERDALEQALHERRPVHRGGLVHHSDGGLNTSAFDTPSASPKPVSSPLSAASETLTTTLSPRRSTASTRRS
jgi:hypothetical protein